jgi:hypothetical protein
MHSFCLCIVPFQTFWQRNNDQRNEYSFASLQVVTVDSLMRHMTVLIDLQVVQDAVIPQQSTGQASNAG